MKLSRLSALAQLFSLYKQIFSLRRVGDNLFCLVLDFDEYYLDMTRGNSEVFKTQEKILGNVYQAPFDLALLKYCSRAKLLKCSLDGHNRILIFKFLHTLSYKCQPLFLYFEFTGRHTNVILVNENQRVVESLRHISQSQSSRVIQPLKPFIPLPQPKDKPAFKSEDIEELPKKLLQIEQIRAQNTLQQKKQVLIRAIQKKVLSAQELLSSLPQQDVLEQQKQQFLQWGNAILAHLHQLEFFVPNLTLKDHEGHLVEIVLPSKIHSFTQGINYCFTQSKKARQKIQNLIFQEENLRDKIVFLQKKIDFIHSIHHVEDLKIFAQKSSKKSRQSKKDYESFFLDGFKISMGKNAKENQKLLEDAKADDLWLHLQNIPSSHMIIHCGKQAVRDELLYKSAKILAGLNGFLDKNITVDYTKRKFVKIVEGANVVYSKQRSLRV